MLYLNFILMTVWEGARNASVVNVPRLSRRKQEPGTKDSPETLIVRKFRNKAIWRNAAVK